MVPVLPFLPINYQGNHFFTVNATLETCLPISFILEPHRTALVTITCVIFGYFFREGAIKVRALDKYRRSVIHDEIERSLDILRQRAIANGSGLAEGVEGGVQ
jgi:hypothetical protein